MYDPHAPVVLDEKIRKEIDASKFWLRFAAILLALFGVPLTFGAANHFLLQVSGYFISHENPIESFAYAGAGIACITLSSFLHKAAQNAHAIQTAPTPENMAAFVSLQRKFFKGFCILACTLATLVLFTTIIAILNYYKR